MNGVRNDPALHVLVGQLLSQICFGENEVVLNFDDDTSITVMSDIGIQPNGFKFVNPKTITSYLIDLLGATVSRTGAISDEILEIAFEGGRSIRLRDESQVYELVVIRLPQSTIII